MALEFEIDMWKSFRKALPSDEDREAFDKNSHPRFKKEFAYSRHQPFGVASDYVRCIRNADSEKLARLIKIVGMLLQTKVYLFWGKPEGRCDYDNRKD